MLWIRKANMSVTLVNKGNLASSQGANGTGKQHIGKHRCKECNEYFPCLFDYAEHLRNGRHHMKGKSAKIRHLFPNIRKDRLNATQGIVRPYECLVCRLRFETNILLEEHMKVHSIFLEEHIGDIPFEHAYCKDKYPIRKLKEPLIASNPLKATDVLENRPKKKGKGKILQCEVCMYLDSHSWRFKQHIRTHFGTDYFLCRVCGRIFRERSDLEKHHETHEDGMAQHDSLCQEVLLPSDYDYELINGSFETCEGFYQCSFCNAIFDTKWDVFAHWPVLCSNPLKEVEALAVEALAELKGPLSSTSTLSPV